jgi:serine/threonine protein kinase/dienelactone hydrolase
VDPKRWQEIERLFQTALEIEQEKREAYLKEACAGDESLCKEVEALLEQQTEAEGFLKDPAIEDAAKALAKHQENALARDLIGRTIAHYRIVEKIGQGGMGEVFLADDTSLHRKVALKFLPPEMQQDSVAHKRMLREAHSAAALDHPYICSVHEVGNSEGKDFIVMEYLEGQTLKERLAKGPLPLDETIRTASEVAEALEEAHEKRIIHRDLKPANIMLTHKGHAKVMDFGLAKQLVPPGGIKSQEKSQTELTRTGITLGTLAYMSPEQLRGETVDARSDIFSFGVVLYEMLSGVHPFRKEVSMATAAAILSEDPAPLAQHAPGIPPQLVKLVSVMLAKTPVQRPQSMGAIRDQLNNILQEVQPRPEEPGILNLKKLGRSLRKPRVAIPAAAVFMVLVFLGVWFVNHQAKVSWAREKALPEIERMIEGNDAWRNLIPVYRLAEKAEAIIPRDAKLAELFSKCSLKINIKTKPPGAKIYIKDYDAPDSEWSYLGVSPIEKIRLPIGIFRWKIEKEGYETVLAASSTWSPGDPNKGNIILPYELARILDKTGSIPTGMVRVQGAKTAAGDFGDFYIDRYEVTNRQYKEFIVNGGYKKREFWKQKFIKDGKELTWEEAMKELVDQTGQPGPSTWQAGDYPEKQGDHPVSGVSWYEAVAYAEYAGKSLPTEDHWGIASGEYTPMIQVPQLGGTAIFAPFSNFAGKGPLPVGSLPSITSYGAFDMPGNVREWCWNETPSGRSIRGGAWDDNPYAFGNRSQAPPVDRSAKNGFRCTLYPDPGKIPATAFQRARFAEPDFYKQKPVPDSTFQLYREQFAYDKTDLRARVEARQESPEGWIKEKITFDAAYGRERLVAYLFLPQNTLPPYQTVIYFPGSVSLDMRSSKDIESYYEFPMFLSFIVKNGRAALYPIYKGTFERGDGSQASLSIAVENHTYTEFLIEVVKDFKRCVDYLETRQDIDSSKLAFYGMSWGGLLGAIIPAVEERLRASVLLGGGFEGKGRPEADQINYVTRVKTPILMMNGKYDGELGTSVRAMFELLGTSPEQKQLKLYETDHIPPRNEYVKETLAWLDRYLGPVK